LHASLLPQYRGAAPINWAIINGEPTTGATTFFIDKEIDTGKIIDQVQTEITENMTVGELYDKLMKLGANLTLKTVNEIASNEIHPRKQEEFITNDLKHAPKIFTKDCEINWELPVQDIHNHVRGLAPFPGAITKVEGKIVKLYHTRIEMATPNEAPGSFITDGKSLAKFACKDGYLLLNDIQWEGKKRMPIEDFLRGYRKPA
jgi:methionyl-tRNA formyltransferase